MLVVLLLIWAVLFGGIAGGNIQPEQEIEYVRNKPDVVLEGLVPKFLKKKPRVTITRTKFDHHIFVGNVSMGATGNGQEGKQYKMIFDTAMPGTLVMGAAMGRHRKKYRFRREWMSDYQPLNPTYYTPQSSISPEHNHYSEYLDMWGNSDGAGYTFETVEKGTVGIGGLVLTDVEFGVVNSMNPAAVRLRGSDYDGIIGLSLHAMRIGALRRMMKKIPKPIFSLYIHPEHDTGNIVFGGINKSRYTGSLQFFPNLEYDNNGNKVNDWRLTFDGLRLGNFKPILGKFVARFESTYQYGIYSPHARVVSTAILNASPGAERVEGGRVVIDCNKRKKLPNLVLKIGAFDFSFTGHEYFPTRSHEWGTKLSGLCQLFVFDNSEESNLDGIFALGVPFMKKYYTVFDAGKEGKIGIARSRKSSDGNTFEQWTGISKRRRNKQLKKAKADLEKRVVVIKGYPIKGREINRHDQHLLEWETWDDEEILRWWNSILVQREKATTTSELLTIT